MSRAQVRSRWVYGLSGGVVLLAIILGFIWGSVADLTVFLLVRPSLPPPWRWLPPLSDYSTVYFALLGIWTVLLLVARWRSANWQRVFAWACVIAWQMAFVSRVVVEVLGEREGPRMGLGELLFVNTLVASSGVVTMLIPFLVLYLVAQLVHLVYSKWKAS